MIKDTNGYVITHDDIEDGMIVKLTDGTLCIVLAQSLVGDGTKSYGSLPVSDFSYDLDRETSDFTIEKIWKLNPDDFRANIENLRKNNGERLLRDATLFFDRNSEWNKPPEAMIEVDGKEYSESTLKKMIHQYIA